MQPQEPDARKMAGRLGHVPRGTDELAAFEKDAAPRLVVMESESGMLAHPHSWLLFDAQRVNGLIFEDLLSLSDD
jgi:hypothetical protein